MKERLGKNTIKKEIVLWIKLFYRKNKYRKKKFKESLKLVSVKKKLILYFIKIDILYLFVFCY